MILLSYMLQLHLDCILVVYCLNRGGGHFDPSPCVAEAAHSSYFGFSGFGSPSCVSQGVSSVLVDRLFCFYPFSTEWTTNDVSFRKLCEKFRCPNVDLICIGMELGSSLPYGFIPQLQGSSCGCLLAGLFKVVVPLRFFPRFSYFSWSLLNWNFTRARWSFWFLGSQLGLGFQFVLLCV